VREFRIWLMTIPSLMADLASIFPSAVPNGWLE
jgi:hypothetical protein